MRILVLGASGMLGHTLLGRLGPRHEVVGAVRSAARAATVGAALGRDVDLRTGLDADAPSSVVALLDAVRPHAVLNAVGLVKQHPDAADTASAIRVNALFPHVVAAHARKVGARLVHVSTDCVFSGEAGGYDEDAVPDARDVYGRSKLLGEVTGPGAVTLRTSIIGPELGTQHGLLAWFLAQRGRVPGYRRAFFSGLTTLALADVIEQVLTGHPDLEGLWHVAGPRIAKLDLLGKLADAYGLAVELVPDDRVVVDRSLDGRRLEDRTSIHVPDWDTMIATMHREAAASGDTPPAGTLPDDPHPEDPLPEDPAHHAH